MSIRLNWNYRSYSDLRNVSGENDMSEIEKPNAEEKKENVATKGTSSEQCESTADKSTVADTTCSTPAINTDNKERYDWKTKYEKQARHEMRCEAIYIITIMLLSLILLLINWLGYFNKLLQLDANMSKVFDYLMYFYSAGMLGGIIFGMKYFYRVIARGFWTQDRRYWRILSPWISAVISLIVGCMALAGLINSGKEFSYPWAVAFGFFSGYFADEALGKMYELATAIFGKGINKG